MEQTEYLWPGGIRLLEAESVFPPGTDAVLLSDFASLRSGDRICDLGCGGGIILLLLLSRGPSATADGVELQPDAAELAQNNLERNGLSNRGRIHSCDLRTIRGTLPSGGFDLVVSNPPYFSERSGKIAPAPPRAAARCEQTCTLEELIASAAYLLRWGGRFALAYRPDRLADLFCALRDAGMEPKRLRLAQHKADSAPFLALVEARRGGRPGLRVPAPLILCNPDGSDTAEVRNIYGRTGQEAITNET